MPRVVPSVVVAFIDKNLPEGPPLGAAHSGAVAALLVLIDHLPDELLQLGPDAFANFLANAEALRDRLSIWRSGADRGHYISREAVTALRAHLSTCPDQSPAPATTALAFIPDASLRDSIRADVSAAHSDLRQSEWKGATVLAGSAIETLLLWALQQHEHQNPGARAKAIATLRAGNNPLTRDPDANPERWDLHEYTEVAARSGLITPDTAAQARLARRFRDLIHPGRAQRLGQKCDIATAHGAIAAVEAVARDLTP